jgi:hypothetical protein
MSMGHADSGQEKERADAGYRVLRELYVGDAAQAAAALRTIWSAGVRWVIAEKYTTMTPVDLAHLYHGPYDGVISRADIGEGDQYMSRLAAVGTQVYNDDEFSVFQLSPARVAAALAPSRGFSAADRSRVASLLATLADGTAAADRTRARDLAALGVRLITFELGALGASPRLVAYGRSMATPVVSVGVPDRRWRCQNLCTGRDLSAFASMGTVIHADPRFSVTVRLRAS